MNMNFPLTDFNTFMFNYVQTDYSYFKEWMGERIPISDQPEEKEEWNNWFIANELKVRIIGFEGYDEMRDGMEVEELMSI